MSKTTKQNLITSSGLFELKSKHPAIDNLIQEEKRKDQDENSSQINPSTISHAKTSHAKTRYVKTSLPYKNTDTQKDQDDTPSFEI